MDKKSNSGIMHSLVRMLRLKYIFLLELILSFIACSSVQMTDREGKDIHLDEQNFKDLEGSYSNTSHVTPNGLLALYSNFKYDTVYNKNNLTVSIVPIDSSTIYIKLIDNQIAIDSMTITGKYRKGYFKIKRQWITKFMAGPLLWGIADNLMYLGLSKENNLVLTYSRGGFLLLFAIPIFAAGSGQIENEYARTR